MRSQKASNPVTQGTGNIKDQISDVADRASDRFDTARHTTANTLHSAARTLRTGGDAVAGAAESTARRLADSAEYLDSRDARRMLSDLVAVIRRNPGRSALIAGVLAFFVARALRSRD
jgi:hypothetical protein